MQLIFIFRLIRRALHRICTHEPTNIRVKMQFQNFFFGNELPSDQSYMYVRSNQTKEKMHYVHLLLDFMIIYDRDFKSVKCYNGLFFHEWWLHMSILDHPVNLRSWAPTNLAFLLDIGEIIHSQSLWILKGSLPILMVQHWVGNKIVLIALIN